MLRSQHIFAVTPCRSRPDVIGAVRLEYEILALVAVELGMQLRKLSTSTRQIIGRFGGFDC